MMLMNMSSLLIGICSRLYHLRKYIAITDFLILLFVIACSAQFNYVFEAGLYDFCDMVTRG